jgi:hypothetical protein
MLLLQQLKLKMQQLKQQNKLLQLVNSQNKNVLLQFKLVKLLKHNVLLLLKHANKLKLLLQQLRKH